jgi:hypothetical protein
LQDCINPEPASLIEDYLMLNDEKAADFSWDEKEGNVD